MQVSVRYDFPATRAVGAFMLGAACVLEGDIAPALEQMEPSYEATFGYGFLGMLPGVIMADTLAGANRNKEALALVMRLLEGSRTPDRRKSPVGPKTDMLNPTGDLRLRVCSTPQGRTFGAPKFGERRLSQNTRYGRTRSMADKPMRLRRGAALTDSHRFQALRTVSHRC